MFYHLKVTFVLLASVALLSLIITAFWFQDWQYSLPTPRPAHLAQPKTGRLLQPALPGIRLSSGKPLFLHFFNPDCPCSRFNLDHIRKLAHDHGAQVQFVAVIEGKASSQIPDLPMPAVADIGGKIARSCGVYSTPQAVLLDRDGKLRYRGNYNVSRYCTERSTEFARVALEALLTARASAALPHSATTAYGCQLPSNPALPVAPRGEFVRFCRRQLPPWEGRHR